MPGARLTVEQRRTIERCYRIGLSLDQIAAIIGKHKSLLWRVQLSCWATKCAVADPEPSAARFSSVW